jgi:uncharacterized protein (TIGR02271 family)
MIVYDKNGLEGIVYEEQTLSSDHNGQVLITFPGEEQVLVPRELLIRQGDGNYHLPVTLAELRSGTSSHTRTGMVEQTGEKTLGDGTLVIPVVEESVNVQKRMVETGVVQIHKTVRERTEVVDQPLQSEQVEIERVPVNRIVDDVIPVRHEGDTMIISLLEEVLVVEKRLMLREEVHVKKLRTEFHDPKEMILREEQLEVVRKPASSQGNQ